jgi:hypothetical protein
MANITLTDQILITKKPVDVKTTPLNSLSELNTTSIPRAWRYQGMEITVLNSDTTGIATRFILHKGTGDSAWKIKDKLIVNTYSEIEPFKTYLLGGTDITVLSDETNNGKLTEYVTGSNNGVIEVNKKSTSTPNIEIIGDDIV